MAPRRLGVGLVYWPELEPLVAAGPETVAVVELEPQGFWEKIGPAGAPRYRPNVPLLDGVAERVRARGQAALLHGVGQPFGGVTGDPVEHLPWLRQAVELFDPAWVSEHLSVNRVTTAAGPRELGFLFPPAQTPSGVRVAARNIAAYRHALGRPVAFETGVTYLRPAAGELTDGDFFGAVAAAADCGILLDLHNLWCNEVNGRASVESVLARMPLERVWEVHLAGGSALDGYLLDAHDALVPEPLLELTERVLPRLPALGALTFEILPEHVEAVSLDAVAAQLDVLRQMWRLVPATVVAPRTGSPGLPPEPGPDDVAEAAAWEHRLATMTRAPSGEDADVDPGWALYQELVSDARRASLARVLRYTMSTLLTCLGRPGTSALLQAYEAVSPPESFAAVEADGFARFLLARPDVIRRVPLLAEVLAFEHALVRATLFAESTELQWSVDPTELLRRLDQGRAPGRLAPAPSRMRVHASA